MTNLHYSEKKNRFYERKFDHDEAKRLRKEGWSYGRLAKHFGVSQTAISRVCDPKRRAQMEEQTRRHTWKHRRKPCKGGCGRLVWEMQEGRTGFCARCYAKMVTANEVREAELKCKRCGKWKPDKDFPDAKYVIVNGERRGRASVSRRHRSAWCRVCSAAARADHRHRFPEAARNYDRRREIDRREDRGQKMEYVVLRKEADDLYRDVGHHDSTSADGAIETIAKEEGEYVAVSLARFEVVSVSPTMSLRVNRPSK